MTPKRKEQKRKANIRYRKRHPKLVQKRWRNWWKKHPEYQERARAKTRQRMYGISAEQFSSLFVAQGKRCAICGTTEPHSKNWHTDHDHVTNIVRGILCGRCNPGLGQFNDDPVLLEQAARYIRQAKVRELL